MSRSPWPWLLAAGPAIVVVASLASAWLAISGGDPGVADEYYTLGMFRNLQGALNESPTKRTGAAGDKYRLTVQK